MSNGRLTIELDTKIEDYAQAEAKAQRTQARTVAERNALNGEARLAREALEIAIEEAIRRGPMEHAEPAPLSDDEAADLPISTKANELIDKLSRFAQQYGERNLDEDAFALVAARDKLSRYIKRLEHDLANTRRAEPAPKDYARGLIDKLLSAANARITERGWSADYDSAREVLDRYIGAMEERSLHFSELQQERIDALNALNAASAERDSLRERIEIDGAGYAQAVKDRDELGRMYAEARASAETLSRHFQNERESGVKAQERIFQLEQELEAAADEIARLEETLRATPHSQEEEILRMEQRNTRESLEIAIEEAIARGPLEHAEPAPQTSASDLIENLLASESKRAFTYQDEQTLKRERADARGRLERWIKALEDTLQIERDEVARLRGERNKSWEERDSLREQLSTALAAINNLQKDYADKHAEIARLEEIIRATDSTSERAPVDCSELEQALAAAKQNCLTQYNRFTHLRDKCEKHSQRLARLSAWLEVLAEGHITPEGVTVGARRGVESLRTVVYDLLS